MQNVHDSIPESTSTTSKTQYNRRSFLQISATIIACITVPLLSPSLNVPSVKAAGSNRRLIRGTADGRILETLDNGRTWQVNADFGQDCSVQEIRIAPQEMVAKIEHKGFEFSLRSIDGCNWVG